jgi:hypothetical protein
MPENPYESPKEIDSTVVQPLRILGMKVVEWLAIFGVTGAMGILMAWRDENRAALQFLDRFVAPYVPVPLQFLAIVIIVFVTCVAIGMVVRHRRRSNL